MSSRGSSSVKRNLTHSFDEVVQPTSCNDDVLKAGNHGLPSSGPVLTHAHLLTSTTQINGNSVCQALVKVDNVRLTKEVDEFLFSLKHFQLFRGQWPCSHTICQVGSY